MRLNGVSGSKIMVVPDETFLFQRWVTTTGMAAYKREQQLNTWAFPGMQQELVVGGRLASFWSYPLLSRSWSNHEHLLPRGHWRMKVPRLGSSHRPGRFRSP